MGIDVSVEQKFLDKGVTIINKSVSGCDCLMLRLGGTCLLFINPDLCPVERSAKLHDLNRLLEC